MHTLAGWVRARRRRSVLLLALAATACGPSVALNANLRPAPVNIGFGAQNTATPQPNVVQFPNLVPNFPAPVEVPPLPFPPISFPGAALACPTPSATSFPAVGAADTATQRPFPAAYQFRYSGSEVFDPNTSTSKTVALPNTGTRQVMNISPVASDGSYTFDVAESYDGRLVTTTYKVVPSGVNGGAVPPPPPNPPIVGPPPPPPGPTLAPQNTSVQAGLYLMKMVGQLTAGDTQSSDTFSPAPPGVLLMPFPAQPQLVFQDGGVDGTTGVAWAGSPPQGGVIQGDGRINACGKVVDSWETIIKGTIGQVQDSTGQTSFTLTLFVATQYGGIIVGDHLAEMGTDSSSGRQYLYDVISNIDTVPLAPQAS